MSLSEACMLGRLLVLLVLGSWMPSEYNVLGALSEKEIVFNGANFSFSTQANYFCLRWVYSGVYPKSSPFD